MTAVISSHSRHFRRAPHNFFCKRFIFNGYFVYWSPNGTALHQLFTV